MSSRRRLRAKRYAERAADESNRLRELYDLTRRHRLIIWIFLSLLQSLGCGSFERIPWFFLQRFLPIATLCWFNVASLGYAAAALDTRSPRAIHASSTWTTSYGPNLVFVNHNHRRKNWLPDRALPAAVFTNRATRYTSVIG